MPHATWVGYDTRGKLRSSQTLAEQMISFPFYSIFQCQSRRRMSGRRRTHGCEQVHLILTWSPPHDIMAAVAARAFRGGMQPRWHSQIVDAK
jgi:hypothetical protein